MVAQLKRYCPVHSLYSKAPNGTIAIAIVPFAQADFGHAKQRAEKSTSGLLALRLAASLLRKQSGLPTEANRSGFTTSAPALWHCIQSFLRSAEYTKQLSSDVSISIRIIARPIGTMNTVFRLRHELSLDIVKMQCTLPSLESICVSIK